MASCNSGSLHILVLLFQLLSILIPLASPLSFNLSGNKLNQPYLNYSNDTSFSNNGVQLTRDQWGGHINHSIGSATYPEQVPLWDKASRTLANFTTNFNFAFDNGGYNNRGDGLAFFLSPFPFEAPSNSGGAGLGLFNVSGNTTWENNVVAVEFDSYRNPGLNDTFTIHVGIDIQSIVSKKQQYLTSGGTGRIVSFNASVSYNAVTRNLSVFISDASDPRTNWSLFYVVDLRDYLPENVAIGFSATTGDAFELHTIYAWDFNSSYLSSQYLAPNPSPSNETFEAKKKSKMRLLVGLAAGIGILLCGLGLVWYAVWPKRARGGMEAEEEEMALELSINNAFERGGGPKKFSYGALAIATGNFVKEAKIGEGGFGEVYKGVLDDTKQEVAIKRISRESKQGKKEYISEVTIISRLRHRNLVQLIGYCHEKGDLLLVYEYMSNKSLDYHLYSEERLLTWPERYEIAFGLASALLYLHEEWEQCVVHRDIKPSNVMLDSGLNAKLGDFGLARLVDHDSNMQTTVMAGTRGYIAPEYATTGKASKESDVYSFGVVLLEIACGRKPIDLKEKLDRVNLVEWVWELYGKNMYLTAVDKGLKMEFDEKQMERFMIVGLWCAHPDYNLRPSIRQAINVLKFDAALPDLPPKMPVAMYFPPLGISNLISASSSSSGPSVSSYSSGSNSKHVQELF